MNALALAWAFALAVHLAASPALSDSLGDLVGQYQLGDGATERTLSLMAGDTYTFTWVGHTGFHAQEDGRARREGTSLTLEATSASESAPRKLLPSALRAVRWGGRLYLISDDDGARFAAHVVRGWEPRPNRNGNFLLRQGDWAKAVRGEPALPPEWQRWLLKSVVEGRVTRALARHRAEINVGSRAQISPGLMLQVVSRKYGWTDVRVVSVHAESSVIENNYGDPPLLTGLRVTSRAR